MNAPDRTELAMLAMADVLLLTADCFASPALGKLDDAGLDRSALDRIGELLDDDDRCELGPALKRCLDRACATDRDDWIREHTRLFEGNVACPINETGYIRRDKGAIIADLCGFYRAFGFEPDETCPEKPDHLCCELQFAALLIVMLVNALKEHDPDAADITRTALQSFLKDHLGEWIVLFHDRLVAASELEWYGHAGALLRAMWNVLARLIEVPDFASLDALGEPPAEDLLDGTPYECGMVEDESTPFVSLTGPAGTGLPRAE